MDIAKKYSLNQKGFEIGGVLFLMGIGVLLRLYHLHQESVWWDEYTSLTHLNASTWISFLQQNRTLDPATLPLYYSLEYFWAHTFGASVTSLRLLSVLLSLLTMPLLYLFGKRCFGSLAGMVALLCFALSPIHVFHGQSIRMYVLFTLLALLSGYSFLQLLRTASKRWWCLHIVANFLLLWTHPFATLLIFTEGVCLAFCYRRPIRRLVLWGGSQGLCVTPLLLYIINIKFWSQGSTASWFQRPSFPRFLADLIADDVVAFTYQLRVSEKANTLLVASQPVWNLLLTALFLFALVGGAFLLRRRSQQNASSFSVQEHIFLLLWLFLPATLLYLTSLVWRPCIFPRYTLHSSLALYLLLGGAIAALPKKGLRYITLGLLIIAYSAQLLLALPGPQRTDWKQAARYIDASHAPNTLVLIHKSIWRDVFSYNLGPSDHPVSSSETLPILADQAAYYLALESATTPVWAILPASYFSTASDGKFEQELDRRKLAYTLTTFPAIKPLWVYQITAKGKSLPSVSNTEDTIEGFTNLTMALAETGHCDQAETVMQTLIEVYPAWTRSYSSLKEAIEKREYIKEACEATRLYRRGCGYLKDGFPLFAIRVLRQAMELEPHFSEMAPSEKNQENDTELLTQDPKYLHIYGLALAESGDYATAEKYLRKTIEIEPSSGSIYESILRNFENNSVRPQHIEAVHALHAGFAAKSDGNLEKAVQHLQRATQLDPDCSAAWHALGLGLIELGRLQEARDVFRHIVTLSASDAILYTYIQQTLENGLPPQKAVEAFYLVLAGIGHQGTEYEKAAEYFQKAIDITPDFALAYIALADIRFLQGNIDAGLAAIDKMLVCPSKQIEYWHPLCTALFKSRSHEQARAEIARLESLGVELPLSFVKWFHEELK